MVSLDPSAVRMRRVRGHGRGEHALCLPSTCELALTELAEVRHALDELVELRRAEQEVSR